MADYKTILERDLERVARPAGFTFDDVVRRRDHKRRNQRITAVAVGIAVFVAAIWIVTSGGPFDRTQTPTAPGDPVTGQTGTGLETGPTVSELPTPTERVGFIGLPPVGATPSTPERGELVLSFFGGTTNGPAARTRIRVYADGRMIWQRDAHLPYGADGGSTGFLEQHLTPEGVELLRSEALSTGLFDHDPDRDLSTYLDIACYNSIRVLKGGRLVQVTYRRTSCVVEDTTPATSEDSQMVLRLDERLSDPASWLPASAWEDPTIEPYVPSRFAVCAAGRREVADLFSVLPPAAADLLRGSAAAPAAEWGPRVHCFDLTTDEARALSRSLEAAGIQRDLGTDALDYWVEDVSLAFSPYMPDGEADCGCGG